MQPEYSFVPATPDDADTIVAIENAAFYEDYVRFGACPGYGVSPAHIREVLPHRDAFLIRAEGESIGYISCRPDGEGKRYLGALAIVPAWQGRGAGRAALAFLFARWPKEAWTLITPAEKARNLRFYTQSGFSVMGEEQDGPVRLYRFLRPPEGA